MRSASPPRATTAPSGVKIDMMGSANRNRAALSAVMSTVARNMMVEQYCIRRFSLFSPAE